MNNSLQDPGFIPLNNENHIRDIVNLSNEVEHELRDDIADLYRDSELANQLLKIYGEEYSDATTEDFDRFGPEDIDSIGDNEDFESILGGVCEGGIEAIAFYKSFRFVNSYPAKGRWGIFFIKPVAVNLIREASYDTGLSISAAFEAVTRLVYVHELYHYKVDATCLQREAISLKPTYIPYRNYVSQLHISDWWEEAVANYYGYNSIQKNTQRYQCPAKIREFLHDMIKNSPGAYAYGANKGGHDLSRFNLSDQLNMSTYPAIIKNPSGHQMPSNLALQIMLIGLKLDRPNDRTLSNLLGLTKCPIYWINPPRRSGSYPKYLQGISIHELENSFVAKYLNGNENRRTDHKFYKIDNGEEVKIPNPHLKNVKTSEMKNILLKAGLTQSQFFKERLRTKIWSKEVPRHPALEPRV